MLLGKIIGAAVATIKTPELEGVKLLIVQPIDKQLQPLGRPQVAADIMQAGPGDIVFMVRAREAALALEHSFVPVDLSVVGIVDSVNIDQSITDFQLPMGYSKFG